MQYKLEQSDSEYFHGNSETFSLNSIGNYLDCILLFYFFLCVATWKISG